MMMKTLIEIHLLPNFAPSNLNRDDTGALRTQSSAAQEEQEYQANAKKGPLESLQFKVELGVISSDDLAVRTKGFIKL